MGIKIIKKRLVVPAQTLAPPRSAEEARKDWKASVPHPSAKARTCDYCQRDYIMPCDDKRHSSCQNWLFRQGKLGTKP